MTIINLTPHPINLIAPDGAVTTIASSGIARVEATETETGDQLAGVPVVRQTLGEVQGLADPVEGVWVVVSRIVAAAAPTRRDLLVPARLVRDDAGRILGAGALEVVA